MAEPKNLTFDEWRKFEAQRIVEMGLSVPDRDNAQVYMRLQIETAIRKAYDHGRSGKDESGEIPMFSLPSE